MKTLQDIYDLIEECNIVLEYQDFAKNILGIYRSNSEVDLIVINRYIESNEMLHRIILAEELGHYFTSIGNNTPVKYVKKKDQLKIDICEEKAMRWSLNYLIPTQALVDYIYTHDYITLDDCCKHFDVPIDFMTRKFESMTLEGVSWKPDAPKTFVDGMYRLLTS